MEKRLVRLFAVILGAMALFCVGCGESETGRALTDSVKKVIGEEISKKTDEAGKQLDRFLNRGAGKGEKNGGEGSDEKNFSGIRTGRRTRHCARTAAEGSSKAARRPVHHGDASAGHVPQRLCPCFFSR